MIKNLFKWMAILLVAILVFIPAHPAAASSGAFDGQVLFGQSFTLKSGDTMEGNLLVFGGSATIDEGGTINGSVVLIGGNLSVNGTVNGDVAVTGGSVTLGDSGHVTGNLTTIAATLDQADGSKVDGQVYNTSTSWVNSGDSGTTVVPHVVTPPVITPSNWLHNIMSVNIPNGFGMVWDALSQSVGLALLAMLVMLFLSQHATRVAQSIMAQPLTTGGLGLLTLVVAPIAVVVTAITLILIPVSIVLVFALIVAGVFGWIAIGYEIGQRFTKAIHQVWHPALTAGLGVFGLTLGARLITAIPVINCITWVVPFALILAALGGVLMTRFGTRVVLAPAAQMVLPPTDTTNSPVM